MRHQGSKREPVTKNVYHIGDFLWDINNVLLKQMSKIVTFKHLNPLKIILSPPCP